MLLAVQLVMAVRVRMLPACGCVCRLSRQFALSRCEDRQRERGGLAGAGLRSPSRSLPASTCGMALS